MLAHRVWVRLDPSSSNLFPWLFIALQNQSKKGSKSCQPILFLIFPIPRYQKEAGKGERGNGLVLGQSIACETSSLRTVSAQIDNGVVKESAASAFTAEVLLGTLSAPAPHHSRSLPSCPPEGRSVGYHRGHPFLRQAGAARSPLWGHGSRCPGMGSCLQVCRSVPSALFSTRSHCCLEGTSRKSSA